MARDVEITLSLPKALADRLEAAADGAGTTVGFLAAQCVEQHLDVAVRHLALIDRLEGVDAALMELAGFVGEATAANEGFDPSSICRYRTRENSVDSRKDENDETTSGGSERNGRRDADDAA